MTPSGQALAGALVFAIGIAGMAGYIPAIRDITYPIVWWGLLAMIDALNFRLREFSIWRGNSGRFIGILLPISVILWTFFEFLNIAAPQWRYSGAIQSVPGLVALGFA